jgi:predicted phosphodiesterase
VLRNPLSIRLFSLIHPGLAVSFAHWFSSFSRNHLTRHKYADQAPLERQAAGFFAMGYRAVVFGHTHQPALKETDGHVFLNLGDFFKNFTYAVYSDGKFRLEKVED